MIHLREVQRFVRQCDPALPLNPGDGRYVAFDEGTPVRGAEGVSVINDLGRTILYSEPGSAICQLFSGFYGSGKTTELRRLKKQLEENKLVPLHVLIINFGEYRTDPTPLSITEVLRVLAYELDREATRVEGGDPGAEQGYLRRFYEFITTTSIDLKGLSFAQVGSTLMIEAKGNPSFRQRLEEALASRFSVFVRDAQEAMAEAIVRIQKATHTEQVVVLVDALEKVTPVREEDRALLEASAETLFVEHAARLRLPCHVVYTFPLWLRFRTAQLDSLYDRPAGILPMVKIAERDGSAWSPGYAKLTELVGKRLDLPKIFGASLQTTLHPLIAASGGYTRDLLRMVREVLWDAPEFPVAPPVIDRIIQRTSESYVMPIRDADADVLAEVARTHELPRGDSAKLAIFGRLLQGYLVLGYRNGKEWYDLHPLTREAPVVKERLAAAQAK